VDLNLISNENYYFCSKPSFSLVLPNAEICVSVFKPCIICGLPWF